MMVATVKPRVLLPSSQNVTPLILRPAKKTKKEATRTRRVVERPRCKTVKFRKVLTWILNVKAELPRFGQPTERKQSKVKVVNLCMRLRPIMMNPPRERIRVSKETMAMRIWRWVLFELLFLYSLSFSSIFLLSLWKFSMYEILRAIKREAMIAGTMARKVLRTKEGMETDLGTRRTNHLVVNIDKKV